MDALMARKDNAQNLVNSRETFLAEFLQGEKDIRRLLR